MTTERDADAALSEAAIEHDIRIIESALKQVGSVAADASWPRLRAALRAQGDSASTLPEDWSGHRIRGTHDCFAMDCRALGDEVEALRDALRRDSATTEGAVRDRIRAASIKACEEHAEREHLHFIPPCASAMQDAEWWARALLADVPDEREGAGS